MLIFFSLQSNDQFFKSTWTVQHTCLATFYLALELSLLLGPVQNQNLPSRGAQCVQHLQHRVSLALCKQDKTLDIALDTF